MRSRISTGVIAAFALRSSVTWLGMFDLISASTATDGTDLARCAVAALEPIVLDEGGLHGMKIARLAETFDCRDLVAFMHDSEGQAGIDAASVDHDSARTTLAVITSLLGSGQMEMLA